MAHLNLKMASVLVSSLMVCGLAHAEAKAEKQGEAAPVVKAEEAKKVEAPAATKEVKEVKKHSKHKK